MLPRKWRLMSLKTRPHDSFVAVGTYVLIRANLYIIRRYAQPAKWSQKCRSFVTRTPLPLFAINERNECIRTKEAYNHPPPLLPVEKTLTTFIYFCAPFCATGNDSRRSTSKCVQTTLRGKSVSHRVCVTTRTHSRTHRIFLCQRVPLSLSLSNTRYLEEVRAPDVTLLCNFNNHILRCSRIRWRMTRILLVAFSTLVCRVTSPAIAEENRAELLALTAAKKGRRTKDPAACPRIRTDSSIMNSSTLHLHSPKIALARFRDHFESLLDSRVYSIFGIMHSIIRQIETSETFPNNLGWGGE